MVPAAGEFSYGLSVLPLRAQDQHRSTLKRMGNLPDANFTENTKKHEIAFKNISRAPRFFVLFVFKNLRFSW